MQLFQLNGLSSHGANLVREIWTLRIVIPEQSSERIRQEVVLDGTVVDLRASRVAAVDPPKRNVLDAADVFCLERSNEIRLTFEEKSDSRLTV